VPVMEPETLYAKNFEGHVAYQTVGHGPVDLVFIPTWVTNLDAMWEEPSLAQFLRRLARFSRLICFDKRGSGVSDPVPLGALPTLEQWMDDVRTVMDAVGSERAALLGHGEGGQMALLFAATYPDRTSALIVADSSARHLRDIDYPWGLPADQMPRFLQQIEERWGTGDNLDIIAPSVAGDERFRRWYSRYERLALSPGEVAHLAVVQFERDLRGVLPTIQVPTLVLHRAGDLHIRVGHGRYLAEHIPGAKYVELPGTDHMFHVGEVEGILGEIQEFVTGMRATPEFDRVLATVLFADIVGSTERVVALGDYAWRELLDTHYAIVRQEIEHHRGHEIETVGDGFLALFDGPARAIRCARAIGQAVRSLGIEIRAGLHTGEIELADNRIRGLAVHIGARVAAAANPGEVLVSSTVKDLVAGSGIRFIDRGLQVLRGVPDEWRLFAVE
jgi:pimeloyl-ACP methyl ester carboxylesterase/class 3 adenylate cyclase